MNKEVIIIGGGIAGLTAAYMLKKHGINPLILEANNRLGGRVFTKSEENNSYELGATWVFQDELLKALIEELELELYPQYLNGDALIKYEPSMAIQKHRTHELMNGATYHKVNGGTGAIIQALADQLSFDRILLNQKVVRLTYENQGFHLTLGDGSFLNCSKVIFAVPPKSIVDQIQISPDLNQEQLMRQTHTWMGDSAKFTVLLDGDYWRRNDLSGFVYSNYGLIREIQDHSAIDGQSYGLLGFIRPVGKMTESLEMRRHIVTQELRELFGIQEDNILGYGDFLWGDYFVDGHNQNYNTGLMPHQNNGHSFYLKSHFEDHLFFAGAETSPINPGYMEGAVHSAYRAVRLLLNKA